MIALRSLAIPSPLKASLSASASACFTMIIFSASPFSVAATLKRCASLFSFFAALLFPQGPFPVPRPLKFPSPN